MRKFRDSRVDERFLPNFSVRDMSVFNPNADMAARSPNRYTLLGAPVSLPQFENACTRRTLADKMRIMAAMSQLPRHKSNKERKNTLVGSGGWRRSA